MNKTLKLTLISLLCLTAILLSSCTQPNTASTDTKYKYVMIGDFSSTDEATLSGATWRGIKLFQKDTYNAETNDRLETVKYYPLAAFSGSDTVSYADARKAAVVKQLELAAAGGASVIILPEETYSTAYASVKDTTKTYGEIAFVILTYPGSITSELVNLNGRTLSLVLNASQLGYMYGYTAVKSGYTAPGYIGIEGAYSESFAAGIAQGTDAAAGEDGKKATFSYAFLTPGSDDKAISDKTSALAGCDLLMGDEYTAEQASKVAGKAFAGTASGASFGYSFDLSVLEGLISAAIKDAVKLTTTGSVKPIGATEGLLKFTSGASEFTADMAAELTEKVKTADIKIKLADLGTLVNVTVTAK